MLEDSWASQVTFPGQFHGVLEAKEENGMKFQVLSNEWGKGGGRQTLDSECQDLGNVDSQNRNQKNPVSSSPRLIFSTARRSDHLENKILKKQERAAGGACPSPTCTRRNARMAPALETPSEMPPALLGKPIQPPPTAAFKTNKPAFKKRNLSWISQSLKRTQKSTKDAQIRPKSHSGIPRKREKKRKRKK